MAESTPPSELYSLRRRIGRIAANVFCFAVLGVFFGMPIAIASPVARWDVPGIKKGLIAIGCLIGILVASVLVMLATAKREGHR